MPSIDDRIVNMRFNNAQFEAGVAETNKSLDSLKDHLNMKEGTDFGAISSGVSKIQSAFSTLGIVGINVLSRLTQEAISFAKDTIGQIVEPIVSGGLKRALNLEQARFQFQGLKLDVEATMAAASAAVEGTAYSLDVAAVAAAQFGASGIVAGKGLESALRGISGVAAMGGRSYEDVSNIFTKIAGQGRLMGDDLNRLGIMGINAAATLAASMGTSEAAVREMVTKGKIDFNTFATAMNDAFGDHATKANETYTGSLGNMRTALARIGALYFDGVEGQFTGQLTRQRDLFNAITPLINAAKNALIPLVKVWSEIELAGNQDIVTLLGDIQNSKAPEILLATFKNISSIVKTLVTSFKEGFKEIFPSAGVKGVLDVMTAIRQFTASLIPSNVEAEQLRRTFAGVFAVFSILGQLVSAVARAFFDIVGAILPTGDGFLSVTANVGDFLVGLNETIKKGDIFNKVFGTIATVVKAPIIAIKALVGIVQDFIHALSTLDASGFAAFVDAVKNRLTPLMNFFQGAKEVLEKFATFVKEKFAEIFGAGDEAAEEAKAKGDNPIVAFFQTVIDGFKGIKFNDVLDAINTGLFGALIISIITFINKGKGLLGRVVGLFSSASTLGGITSSFNTVLKSVSDGITTTFGAVQQKLRADALIKIAIAIGVMTVSIIALSMVDSVRLAAALGAITIMTLVLGATLRVFAGKVFTPQTTANVAAMAASLILLAIALDIIVIGLVALSKVPIEGLTGAVLAISIILMALILTVDHLNTQNPAKLAATAAALIILSLALNSMAGAVKMLAELPAEELEHGLGAVILLLAALVSTTHLLGDNTAKTLVAADALGIMALALLGLAVAIRIIGTLQPLQVAVGVGAIVILMGALVGATHLLGGQGPKTIIAAQAIAVMAASLLLLATAVRILGTMSVQEVTLGLIAIGILLTGMILAANALQGSLAGIVAMIFAAGAILILAAALKIVATMSWDDIGRSLVVLAGSLAILAGAMALMGIPLVLLGAVGLVAAAGAMMMLAPALVLLGTMSWDDIGRGLAVLASALGILALGGLLLIPAIPGLLGLGFAILLLGVGVMAAGVGIGMLAAGIGVLVLVGQAGIALFIEAVKAFAEQIPTIAIAVGEGLVAIAVVIGQNAPILIAAFVEVLLALLDAADQVIPEFIVVATDIIVALVEALIILIPLLVDAGLKILTGILKGIGDNIGDITEEAINILVNFVNSLANNIWRVIDAGANLVVKYIDGLAKGIKNNSTKFVQAGSDLFRAIVDGVSKAIERGGADLRYAGERIGNALIKGAKNALGINSPSKVFRDDVMPSVYEGIEDGNDQNINRAAAAGEDIGNTVGNSAMTAMQDSLSQLAEALDLSGVDTSPTIRPVLDLTDIQNKAGQVAGMLSTPTLSLGASSDVAQSVSLQEQSRNAQIVLDASMGDDSQKSAVTFNQYNNSPKALSTAEVYRQTKNQLSTLKEGLGVVDQSGSS